MKRNNPPDKIIWEGVQIFSEKRLDTIIDRPPDLCITKGHVERIDENYFWVKREEGDWIRIPAALVKKLVRGKKT